MGNYLADSANVQAAIIVLQVTQRTIITLSCTYILDWGKA